MLARTRTGSHSPRNTATLSFWLQLWFPEFERVLGSHFAHHIDDTIVEAWHPQQMHLAQKGSVLAANASY